MSADLHIHTTASDGLFSPEEVVRMAKDKGLRAIAITDHDTVGGVAQAAAAAAHLGIELVPGIEISTLADGQDVHVLGYFVDTKQEWFLKRLQSLRNTREERNRKIIEKLNELGIAITWEEVQTKKRGASPEKNIGRPHIAELLVDKGIVRSMDEAFERYLGKDGAAYVTTRRITPFEAIDLIKEAGGVPVLAHPGLYENDELVEEIIAHGLVGLEVYHPDHDEERTERYREMAERHGLIVTAGSDFHGERHGSMFHAPIGTKTVVYKQVERLKSAARK
ncbi:PHP domain-containing protein [Polycladomyces subterraneus]|uniref:PHP domain-containing protein n=1 Tax=Polycladomyces subterraneus TaxID=1016997 RepID=A0ABT8IQ29_9BACL|nr:PHP domain-containing protein [Polycladomyces subterraneus]MDN4594900.1 PHP domain-containing protein [Polycladomyces subterraneus]